MGISVGLPSGGVSTKSGALIAEWNRTDLSQLVSGGASDYSAGGATRSLSVVSVPERGNVLRCSGGSGGATATQIFMFSAASGILIPSTDERRDVNIEIEYLTVSAGNGSYAGIFFGGDLDTPLHGFGHVGFSTSAEWGMALNNGVRSDPNTGSFHPARYPIYNIRGRKPAGSPPQLASFVSGWDLSSGEPGEPRRSGSDSTARGGGVVRAYGNNISLGATWDDISADRIGLLIQSSGGNACPTFDILSFRVFRA